MTSPMFHKGSLRLLSSSFCVLESKNCFTLIFTSYYIVIKMQISTLKNFPV